MSRTDLIVDEEPVAANVEGAIVQLVPVFGPDKLDVLYVRVRSEYGETESEAVSRAIRIVQRLKPAAPQKQ